MTGEVDSPLMPEARTALFGGCYIPNEVFLLILDVLPFEDRANLAATCSQLRRLALQTLEKLKIMRDLSCTSQ